jgi:hypothetical protein
VSIFCRAAGLFGSSLAVQTALSSSPLSLRFAAILGGSMMVLARAVVGSSDSLDVVNMGERAVETWEKELSVYVNLGSCLSIPINVFIGSLFGIFELCGSSLVRC